MLTPQSPRLQVALELTLPVLRTWWNFPALLKETMWVSGGACVPCAPTSPSLWRYLYLVRVCTEVKVFYEARREFTEEEVVGLIDGPQAPVCVIVGAGAGTEGPHCGRKQACSKCIRRNMSLSGSLSQSLKCEATG